MKPFKVRILAVSVAALGLGISTFGQPATTTVDDKRVAAQSAILKLSDNLDAKDVAERAKQIVKEHASEDISSVFKIRAKGGLGIGKLTEVTAKHDGIERLLLNLQRRRTITEAEIEKYADDYLRVAKVIQAMAELAPYRATERVQKDSKLTKEWQEVTHEFKEGARTFRKAVDEKDPKRLRLAAEKMENTCCHCHDLADR